MERNYLKFLVTELIFVKEDTIINLIPKTYERYHEIFGDLEKYVDTLNLNIRKLRRNIKLLDKFTPEDAKKKSDEEFEKEFEELCDNDIGEFSSEDEIIITDEKKKKIEDIFREIIFYYSPKLNDFPLEEFEKAEELFKNCDENGLIEFLKRDRPGELDISSEKLQFMREDLEIEISIIFDRFPLNQLDMLDDKDAIDFNLKRLKSVYEEYQEIYGGLGEELNLKIAEKYLPRN
ncbi:hypothetical protein [Peptoniphilus senegalensis]|uniref:hypothetical protein n=1 Tax=Peptoniphilus senegalensis TaxID=1465757 RepID=UPI0002F2C955|nr:hypothetical protein [Peptoniphilus senegalensis]